MSLFQQSTITFGDAIDRVLASTASTTSNTTQKALAVRAIQEATKEWNTRGPWEFTKVTPITPITVVAGTASYDLPYDVYVIYDVRINTGGREYPVYPASRRHIDRVILDQSSQGSPFIYDLYRQGAEGKIQLTPTPDAAGTLTIKYFRKLVVPCTKTLTTARGTTGSDVVTSTTEMGGIQIGNSISCATPSDAILTSTTVVKAVTSQSRLLLSENATFFTSGTVTLQVGNENYLIDFPADYDQYLIALASEQYLMLNNEDTSRIDRMRQKAEEGFVRAAQLAFKQTDEDLAIQPPPPMDNVYPLGVWNDGWNGA